MNLLKNLNFYFIMIYITCKMLVLLKNNLNYLKDSISECLLRSIIDFYFFFTKFFFHNM